MSQLQIIELQHSVEVLRYLIQYCLKIYVLAQILAESYIKPHDA